jgi:hypothetical protein
VDAHLVGRLHDDADAVGRPHLCDDLHVRVRDEVKVNHSAESAALDEVPHVRPGLVAGIGGDRDDVKRRIGRECGSHALQLVGHKRAVGPADRIEEGQQRVVARVLAEDVRRSGLVLQGEGGGGTRDL